MIKAILKKDGEPVCGRQFYTVTGCIIIDLISAVRPLQKGDNINVYCHATDKITGQQFDAKHGIEYDGVSLQSSVEKGEQELRDYYDAHKYSFNDWRNFIPCVHE